MNKFKIYGRSVGCSFCDNAKKLVLSNNDRFEFIEVTSFDDFPEEVPAGARKVPQILRVDEKAGELRYVGGHAELEDFCKTYSTEELKKKRTVFNTENTGHVTGDYT